MNVANLDAFLERVRTHNPFTDNRVTGASDEGADVPAVHRSAFERMVELSGETLREGRGLGTVLWGEAGVGKSHLLSRLARWAGRNDRAYFFSIHNLQASPEHLPRSVLRMVMSQLVYGRREHFDNTPLYRLVHAGINEAVDHKLQHYGWGALERAFLNKLSPVDPVERTADEILFRFFKSIVRARQGKEDGNAALQAVRWLSGNSLGLADARNAGLPSGPPGNSAGLLDNQDVKAVFLALSRLASLCGRPFVLAFDQVDNLDVEQAGGLARFLQALIDASPNLLVITAGVQSTLLDWREKRVIQESAWHRLAHFEVQLLKIAPADALQIVAERLRRVIEPFNAVHAVHNRMQDDLLFPLGRAWKDRFLKGKSDVRPRDVLNWARDGWQAEQDALKKEGNSWLDQWEQRQRKPASVGERPTSEEEIHAAIDRRVAEKLAGQRSWRESVDSSLPPDAGHIEGLLYATLIQCRDAGGLYGIRTVERVQPGGPGGKPPFDLMILQKRSDESPGLRTGLLVLTATSATSVAGYLRRLLEDPRPLDRLLLVTDERVGLPLGAKGLEYLHDLEQGGPHKFQRLELTFAEYAELDALQAVVGLARCGDLEIEPRPGLVRPVTESEVVAAHHRLNYYLNSRVLREVLSGMSMAAAELLRTQVVELDMLPETEAMVIPEEMPS